MSVREILRYLFQVLASQTLSFTKEKIEEKTSTLLNVKTVCKPEFPQAQKKSSLSEITGNSHSLFGLFLATS